MPMAPFSPHRWVVLLILAACLLLLLNQQSIKNGAQLRLKSIEIPVHPAPPEVKDGRFHWRDIPTKYPPPILLQLPTGRPKRLPSVQHIFGADTVSQDTQRRQRQKLVKDAFSRCWTSYKQRAWMKDELLPLSGGYRNTFGGWAATLVDTLDTLHIMGMAEDFDMAVEAAKDIDFSVSDEETVNVFETTIRYLGGFLSAYDLSGEQVLIDKAVEVGEMLYVAFDTPNRMPVAHFNWREAAAGGAQVASTEAWIAEFGSISLEFTRLSQITNNPKWFDAVQRISNVFANQQNLTKLPGMWPVLVDVQDLNFTGGATFTLGGMADSFYEYLVKEYALLGGLSPLYRTLYESAMTPAIKYNFFRPMVPNNADILFSGSVDAKSPDEITLDPQNQHLVCFTGGMLGLGSKLLKLPDHLDIARKLTDGCIWAYDAFPFGIMPETFLVVPCTSTNSCVWDESKWHSGILDQVSHEDTRSVSQVIADKRLPPGITDVSDAKYILRPEAIESIFVLYRITGDKRWQEAAWKMFEAIDKYTKTEFANAALDDVTVTNGAPPKFDDMQSFWTAETLKYLYLIFSEPTLISLDDFVFNTEAHPFKRPV